MHHLPNKKKKREFIASEKLFKREIVRTLNLFLTIYFQYTNLFKYIILLHTYYIYIYNYSYNETLISLIICLF